jgi:hypothetical protein
MTAQAATNAPAPLSVNLTDGMLWAPCMVENVVAFLTEGIGAQQLAELASLLDSKHCDLVHLY